MRRDLWAKVTRALFYDLVELGEEREVDGERMFGVASEREFFAMAPADELEGFRVMDGLLASDARAIGREFFARARARLTLDVPPALTDPDGRAARAAISISIRSLWERAGVAATRPAAVLVAVVDAPEPTVLLTLRTAASREPCRADRVSRRQDRAERRDARRRRAARGRGGDRARAAAWSSRSAISISI